MAGSLCRRRGDARRLTPDYPFNCKRPVRDPDYLRTFNRDNVELVDKAVVSFTERGLVAEDGIERPADIVVMATGFKASSFLSTPEGDGPQRRRPA